MSERQRQAYDWLYRKAAWQRVRQMALSRDNGLCTRCYKQGIIKRADVVHHIIYLTTDATKAFDVNNLECLCHACHNKEHDEKGAQTTGQFKSTMRNGLMFDSDGNIVEEQDMITE